jgi:hypothetical protein
MAKRTNRMAWGLAVAVLVCGGGFFLFGERIDQRAVDHLIRIHLPLGSDKREVLRFLDARGWYHGGVETLAEFDRRSDPKQIEYGAAEVIRAEIDNVGPGCKGLGFLQIGFAFNKQGKLVRYGVDQLGPDML